MQVDLAVMPSYWILRSLIRDFMQNTKFDTHSFAAPRAGRMPSILFESPDLFV